MNPITRAISECGSTREFSRLLGVTPSLISQWATGHRPISLDRCAQIERATSGAVTCEELRPDVRWVRVCDPGWPHPEGRPLVDVTPAAVSQEEAA